MFAGWNREVALTEMLDARERRAAAQGEMLRAFGLPLVSFTLNIPGPVKDGALVRAAFREGKRQIEATLLAERIDVAHRQETCAATGCEALYAVRADALRVKRAMRAVEERCEIGRYYDIDVIGTDGAKTSRAQVGAPERRCFLCGKPAAECARSRAHSVPELQAHVFSALNEYLDDRFAEWVAEKAVLALLYEVAVTPKPGLVDRANSGAHADMDFFTFQRSAAALTAYFRRCALSGLRGEALDAAERFETTRHLGTLAERDMLCATGGVNTHKGAVFSLGTLCAAAGFLRQTRETFDAAALCGEAAAMVHGACEAFAKTHGGKLYGARLEAARGFETVRQIALPALKAALARGKSVNDAGVETLLALLCRAEDTNLIRRGGADAPQRLRARVLARREAGENALDAANALDAECIAENLSPGGCADLLALAFFFLFLEEGAEN